MLYCTKRGPVTRGMDNIKKARGESTHNMNSLRMKAIQDDGRKLHPPHTLTPSLLKRCHAFFRKRVPDNHLA